MEKESKFPHFSKEGFIDDYVFKLERAEKTDGITGKLLIIFIKRDRVPESKWYIDKTGKKHEWK